MKTELFQSCGHCWVFQICWHIECSTFTASSFRIWTSSPRIPSPPLALSIVMLPKAHLTSHSRMSDSRWVITPLWLSGSRRSCLYSSSVYSYYLFFIASASVMSIPFLSFIAANDIIFFFLWLSSIPLYYIHCIILYTHIIYIVHYIHYITHTHTHTHTHTYTEILNQNPHFKKCCGQNGYISQMHGLKPLNPKLAVFRDGPLKT